MSLTDQNAPYSLYFWMEEFQESDNWPAVLRTARELLHLIPDNPEALRYLAEAHYRLDQPEEAYRAALRLVEVNPLSIDGFWILSDLAAQADDLEQSADYIETAAQLIPNSDAIWVEVARANFHLRRLSRCLLASDEGLRINPLNIRLLILRVFCLAALQRRELAREAASRLNSLGVDAEVLREAAKELGITGSVLSKLNALAQGEAVAALQAPSGVRKNRQAVDRCITSVSHLSSRAAPLTPKQFELQLEAARLRREADEEDDDDADPSAFAPDSEDPEDHVESAAMVYFVFDKFRVHGPYVLRHLVELFRDSTFSLRDAFVRRETDSTWTPAPQVDELQSLATSESD